MEAIEKTYIYDSENRKVAVQIDIEVFEKIENILEDYSFGKLIEKNRDSDLLDLIDAENYYKTRLKEK